MRREKQRTATVILGSILAFAIAFSQYFTLQPDSVSEKVKTEQSGCADEGSTFISLPTFSIPAPLSVQASLDAYCLFEILFEEDIDENFVEDVDFQVDRFFVTMFRVIISPNAP